jgi:hypothetical protein
MPLVAPTVGHLSTDAITGSGRVVSTGANAGAPDVIRASLAVGLNAGAVATTSGLGGRIGPSPPFDPSRPTTNLSFTVGVFAVVNTLQQVPLIINGTSSATISTMVLEYPTAAYTTPSQSYIGPESVVFDDLANGARSNTTFNIGLTNGSGVGVQADAYHEVWVFLRQIVRVPFVGNITSNVNAAFTDINYLYLTSPLR